MKRTTAIALAALTAIFVGVFAYAQPVPGGGLKFVTHDGTLTGAGTSASPLGALGSISGLTTNRIPKATSATGIGDSTGTSSIGASSGDTLTINSTVIAASPFSATSTVNFSGATSTTVGNLVDNAQVQTSASGQYDNYSLTSTTQTLVFRTIAATQLTGIAGGSSWRRIRVLNDGAQCISVYDENVFSTTTNRIRLEGAATGSQFLCNGEMDCLYDSSYLTGRWMCSIKWGQDSPSSVTIDGALSVTSSSAFQTTSATDLTVTGNTTLGDATGDAIILNGNSIVLNAVTNGAATTTFNANGYLSSTTQFRNIQIDDGKNGAIAFFGQIASAPAGSIENVDSTADQVEIRPTTTNIGKDTASVISFRNGPTGINLYGGKHFECTEEFMFGGSEDTANDASFGACGLSWHRTSLEIIAEESSADKTRLGIVALKTNLGTNGDQLSIFGGKGIAFDSSTTVRRELTSSFDVLSSSSSATPSQYISLFGLTDSAFNATSPDVANGCYFLYDKGNVAAGNKNAGNVDAWECWCANGSTRTGYLINASGNSDESFALGTGAIAATTWYRLKILVTGTTRAEFFRNGTKVCDINTNMPTSTTLKDSFFMISKSSTGNADRHWRLDQATFAVDLSAVRSP